MTSTKAAGVVNVLKVVVGVCVVCVIFGALQTKTQHARTTQAQDRMFDAWRQRAAQGQPPVPGIAVKDGVLYLACDGDIQRLDARTLAALDHAKADAPTAPAKAETAKQLPTQHRAQPR